MSNIPHELNITAEKQCSKCGEVKALELFRNGHNQCKACISLQNKAYYEANPDKTKKVWREVNSEKIKAYREANSEKIKAQCKAYYEANREKLKEINAKYSATHPEIIKASKTKYRKANPEKFKVWQDKYVVANREKVKAADKAYRDANLEKVKEKRRAVAKTSSEQLKDDYILRTLCITKAQATPGLIALKRNQLELIRIIRKVKHERSKVTQSSS